MRTKDPASTVTPLEPATRVKPASEPSIGLAQLRKALRNSGRRDIDPFDAFYRVYVTALIGLVGFYFSLGLVDEVARGTNLLAWAETHGRGWVGLIAATVVSAGARSGANGGPLMIDDREIHHILLSPLSRRAALADSTRRLAVAAGAIGSIIGAAVGELASRQLPGTQIEWVLAGLLSGGAIATTGVGASFIAAGFPRHKRIIKSGSLALPTWAVVDLVTGTRSSVSSVYGDLALWPINQSPLAAVALVASPLLVWWGWRRIISMSIESVHHRSRLIRQIRFAMARQDIRSLLLLRRQLGFETPRSRPWFIVRGGGRVEAHVPVLVRDLRSYARWPVARLARSASLALTAGLALAAVWNGTTAVLPVVGISLYMMAIEVIEPLSQELDHPGILELIPTPQGGVILSHLISAIGAMSILWVAVGAVAAGTAGDWRLAGVSAIAVLPASAAAVAAAGLSIARFDSPAMVPSPEVEGPRVLLRLLWPPALATSGALPMVVARNSIVNGTPFLPGALTVTAIVAMVAAAALTWIRFRDEIKESMFQTQGESS